MRQRKFTTIGMLLGLVVMAGGCVDGWSEGFNDGISAGVSSIVESILLAAAEPILPAE